MSKKAGNTHRPEMAVLPQLKDPQHPGMQLVSRVAVFSLSLFLLLFVLVAIAGNRVMLDFELNAQARFADEQLWVTIDEQKASVFKPGDELIIHYENGLSLSGTVSQMGIAAKGELTMLVMVSNDKSSALEQAGGTQDIGLTIEQPLKEFIMSKVSF